jgi:hypothetical protein
MLRSSGIVAASPVRATAGEKIATNASEHGTLRTVAHANTATRCARPRNFM